jgi:ApbE superfamily uncharacterized protein (UPF0280 family)
MGNERWKTFRVEHLETDLWIAVTSRMYRPEVEAFALEKVMECRKELDNHIKSNPAFLSSLEPVEYDRTVSPVVREMYEASEQAGTGPMSAVAGAVAENILNTLFNRYQFEEIVVENGGDIFMKLKEPATISVYVGDSPLSDKIGLKIKPGQTPVSVCCSSATVGHSLSFGTADACVVACSSGALADAYATACCNTVKNIEMIQEVTQQFLQKPGILSVLIIQDDRLAIGGNLEMTVLQK